MCCNGAGPPSRDQATKCYTHPEVPRCEKFSSNLNLIRQLGAAPAWRWKCGPAINHNVGIRETVWDVAFSAFFVNSVLTLRLGRTSAISMRSGLSPIVYQGWRAAGRLFWHRQPAPVLSVRNVLAAESDQKNSTTQN